MRNPAPFDGVSERPANLEWRDSVEAACLKKRRRFPDFSLTFLTDFLLADPGVPPEKGSKDSFFSRDSEAARPWEGLASSSWDERSARVAVLVCWRATN